MRTLPPAPLTFAEVCALDTLIGQAFAEVAADAIAHGGPVDLICSHGQTVYHWVDGRDVLGTLQIGQPAWIAERSGVPVVADIRIRDIVAGGQGAPLVSLDGHDAAGRRCPAARPALNLGGIANMTVLRPAPTRTRCAARLRHRTGQRADRRRRAAGHRRASTATTRTARSPPPGPSTTVCSTHLLDEPYYRLAAPKTTGKELFNADYLDQALAAFAEHHRRRRGRHGHGADRADGRRRGAPVRRRHAGRLGRRLRQPDADGDARRASCPGSG